MIDFLQTVETQINDLGLHCLPITSPDYNGLRGMDTHSRDVTLCQRTG